MNMNSVSMGHIPCDWELSSGHLDLTVRLDFLIWGKFNLRQSFLDNLQWTYNLDFNLYSPLVYCTLENLRYHFQYGFEFIFTFGFLHLGEYSLSLPMSLVTFIPVIIPGRILGFTSVLDGESAQHYLQELLIAIWFITNML